jgi:hypothetical protein
MSQVLQYDPAVYQSFGSVEAASAKSTLDDIKKCGENILASGLQNIIGICLIHRHFDLDDKSVMVQSIDQHNAQMITKPELVANNLTIKPSAWKIQDKGIVPFQFAKVEHDETDETNKLQSALISVADGIREKGLSETLGLCLLEGIECPEGHQLVERTEIDPDMLIVEPIHNDKVDENNTLTTIFRFDGDAEQGCSKYTSCIKDNYGGHYEKWMEHRRN